jgi:arsenite methyltransferase
MLTNDGNRRTVTNIYEQVYTHRPLGETLHPGGVELTQRILSRYSFSPTTLFLDLGCGSGKTVHYLQSRGFQAIGLDLSRFLLSHCKQFGKIPFSLLQADGDSIPFVSASIDVIVAECTFSLFLDTISILKELSRVLSAKGMLIISDLFTRNPSALPDVKKMFPQSCLAHAFAPDDLSRCFAQSGFTIDVWEDHSEILKSLSGGAMLSSFACSSTCKVDPMEAFLTVAKAKIGYFVCVVKK